MAIFGRIGIIVFIHTFFLYLGNLALAKILERTVPYIIDGKDERAVMF